MIESAASSSEAQPWPKAPSEPLVGMSPGLVRNHWGPSLLMSGAIHPCTAHPKETVVFRGLTNAASEGAARSSHHTEAGLTLCSKLDMEIKIK